MQRLVYEIHLFKRIWIYRIPKHNNHPLANIIHHGIYGNGKAVNLAIEEMHIIHF